MKIERLKLVSFRNHGRTEIGCSPTVNLFVGPNGQGKTNILESIAYLSIGKSFFSAPDSNLVRHGDGEFIIHGSFRSDTNLSYTVGIRYSEDNKKKEVKINSKEQERVSSLIGKFPIVLLHPEQHSITNGGPAERRRFIDLVLSQAHPSYFEMLTEYRKVLRQRNAILGDMRNRHADVNDLLDPWNEPLIDYAIKITGFRYRFLRELNNTIRENYRIIAGDTEKPTLRYEPVVPLIGDTEEGEVRERARQTLRATGNAERRYGTTVFGPHRDELVLLINDMEVRKYASQGQQKSFLVALKISESQYLLEKRQEQPIILLDDLFGELDRKRASRVLELTTGMGQTFVTSADDAISDTHYTSLNGHTAYWVESGKVTHAEETAANRWQDS
jgi:DNA replication and repair protein RecF